MRLQACAQALEAFEEQLSTVFLYGLTSTQQIPELEPLIMDQMFWGKDNFLKTLHKEEPAVVAQLKRVRAAGVHAAGLLRRYLTTFDPFKKLLKTKVIAHNVHTIALNVHNIALNVHALALIVHPLALNAHLPRARASAA